MTKAELIATIEQEWEALQAAIAGLSDEQMTRQSVFGAWTVKDVLAHIAVWQSHMITNLYKVRRGVKPELGLTDADVDRLNAQFYREQKDRPLERVLEDLHGVHLALLNRLEDFSDAELFDPKKYSQWFRGAPLSEHIASNSYEHYQEHAADIRAWRGSTDRQRING
jgi:uncharacterized protein (TIGR03083 family)